MSLEQTQSKNTLTKTNKIYKKNFNEVVDYINSVSIKKIIFNNIFIFQGDYVTNVFTKESIKNGHKTIDGVFRAVSKDKVPNQPNNVFIGYFYSNNKNQNYISNNNNYNNNKIYEKNNSNNNDLNLIKSIFLIIFISIIILLVVDFFSMYRQVKRDNKIDRDKCIEEYLANNCDKMKINDGPLINEFCFEKRKCKEFEVFFHEILIRYIKNILFISFKGINLARIIIILISFLILFGIFF